MNYDDTTFYPYYELYYTGIIVAEYYDLEREIIQIESEIANQYVYLVSIEKMELTDDEDCLAD